MSLAIETAPNNDDKDEFLVLLDYVLMGMTDDSWRLVVRSAYKYR